MQRINPITSCIRKYLIFHCTAIRGYLTLALQPSLCITHDSVLKQSIMSSKGKGKGALLLYLQALSARGWSPRGRKGKEKLLTFEATGGI